MTKNNETAKTILSIWWKIWSKMKNFKTDTPENEKKKRKLDKIIQSRRLMLENPGSEQIKLFNP